MPTTFQTARPDRTPPGRTIRGAHRHGSRMIAPLLEASTWGRAMPSSD